MQQKNDKQFHYASIRLQNQPQKKIQNKCIKTKKKKKQFFLEANKKKVTSNTHRLIKFDKHHTTYRISTK